MKRPLLRRWNHRGDPKAIGGALQITEQDSNSQGLANGWIALEDGVQVWFAKGGQYRAGDQRQEDGSLVQRKFCMDVVRTNEK